jgi:hypothetical protein
MFKASFAIAVGLTAAWMVLLAWLLVLGFSTLFGTESVEQPQHAEYEAGPNKNGQLKE